MFFLAAGLWYGTSLIDIPPCRLVNYSNLWPSRYNTSCQDNLASQSRNCIQGDKLHTSIVTDTWVIFVFAFKSISPSSWVDRRTFVNRVICVFYRRHSTSFSWTLYQCRVLKQNHFNNWVDRMSFCGDTCILIHILINWYSKCIYSTIISFII